VMYMKEASKKARRAVLDIIYGKKVINIMENGEMI